MPELYNDKPNKLPRSIIYHIILNRLKFKTEKLISGRFQSRVEHKWIR